MAAFNIDSTGGKSSGSIDNGNGNSNNNGSIGNGYSNSRSIGNNNNNNNNSGTIGNGNAYHHNYGTVHNMFIVLNICPGSGADADDGDQDQDRGAAPMVARVLGVIGVVTSSIAPGATAYKYNSPRRVVNHGRELAYLFAMVVVFLAGLAEVGAAFWVSADNRNRYGASRKIMRAAIVLLVLTVGLGYFAIVFKN